MKFLHIADLHLGKALNQNNLIEDQKYILDEIISIMDKNDCHIIVLAGDIYDKSIPSREAVKLFNDFITKLIKEKKATVLLVSGNHDSMDRLNFASDILKEENLYISSRVDKTIDKYILNEDGHIYNFYMLPYTIPQMFKEYNEEEEIKTYNDMMKFIINNNPLNKEETNILITHHTVLGDKDLLHSDSEMPVSIGGTDAIEGALFKDFDYVALGHLHTAQKVLDNIYYSGSILKYSESESKSNKACLLVSFDKDGTKNVDYVELKPLHDLITKHDFFENLMNEEGSDDYVYITLKDKTVIANAMSILKTKYPNALGLKYDIYETSDDTKITKSTNSERKTIAENFKDFYKEVKNDELSDEEALIFERIYKEVINNEAD